MTSPAPCCYIGPIAGFCGNDATWNLYTGSGPDDNTQSCDLHVGALLEVSPLVECTRIEDWSDFRRNERGEWEWAVVDEKHPHATPERVAYLEALTAARALVDDGAGAEIVLFQCADPRHTALSYSPANFIEHVQENHS